MEAIVLDLPPLPHYVTVGRTCYTVGDQHPNRRNIGIFDWLYVRSGTLYIGEEGKEWAVRPCCSLLLLPEGNHYATAPCREETVFYWIHFNYDGQYRVENEAVGSLLMRHAWSNSYQLKLTQFAVHSPSSCAEIERLLEQLSDQSEAGRGTYWREQQRFMDLLHILEEERPERRFSAAVMSVAERTEACLRQHYQTDLTNEMLGELLHFHPNYIIRCMKEVYKCSPMDYLYKLRMEQAKLLLIKTEWPVSVIAEQVGYQYPPYFSNCFKRYEGLSPTAFRKRYAN